MKVTITSQIYDILCEAQKGLTATELATQLNIPVSKACSLLSSMYRQRKIDKSSTKPLIWFKYTGSPNKEIPTEEPLIEMPSNIDAVSIVDYSKMSIDIAEVANLLEKLNKKTGKALTILMAAVDLVWEGDVKVYLGR